MRQHLTIVAVLHVILNALSLIGGLMIVAASMAAGALVGANGASGTGLLVGTIGTIIGVILIAVSIPGLLFAYGIWRQRPWSRTLGFVISVIHLINIPIGTLIGAYTIWVLMQPETEMLLSGNRVGV